MNIDKNYNNTNTDTYFSEYFFSKIQSNPYKENLESKIFIDNYNDSNYITIKEKDLQIENKLFDKEVEKENGKIDIFEFKNKPRNLAARKRKKRKTGKKISLRWK
jgi:hypothetical protein